MSLLKALGIDKYTARFKQWIRDEFIAKGGLKTINGESIEGVGNIEISGGSSVNADWNQHYSTQPDYIKNRTHYETVEDKTIYQSVCGYGEVSGNDDIYGVEVSIDGFYDTYGKEREVRFTDGIEYYTDWYELYSIPTKLVFYGSGNNPDYGYGEITGDGYENIRIINTFKGLSGYTEVLEISNPYDVGLVCEYREKSVVTPLDEKFIPNTVIKTIPQTLTDAQKSQARENIGVSEAIEEAIAEIPAPESDVFKAIYGETTYEEIVAASNAGKVVLCKYGTIIARLIEVLDSVVYFMAAGNYVLRVSCFKAGAWSYNSYNHHHELEDLDNGNVQVTIAGKSAEVVTPQNVGKQGVIRQTQTWTQASDGGYDYVMSDLVRGWIPQANIDLFVSAGAVFNEESGYFELNGLTDISYQEMQKIYSLTLPYVRRSDISEAFAGIILRTNFPIWDKSTEDGAFGSIAHTAWDLRATCYGQIIEVCCIIAASEDDNISKHNSITNIERFASFSGDTTRWLKKVIGVLGCANLTSFYQAFRGAWSLEDVRLYKVKANVEFAQSPRLSYDSIKFLIANTAATSTITVTLHATALANAETAYLADAEQDLTTYPTLQDWATSKNITLAV